MRREGYEFQVSPARVLYKEIDGKKCERLPEKALPDLAGGDELPFPPGEGGVVDGEGHFHFDSYAPYKGDIQRRGNGSLISFETGESITYGLFNAQERGTLFTTQSAGTSTTSRSMCSHFFPSISL